MNVSENRDSLFWMLKSFYSSVEYNKNHHPLVTIEQVANEFLDNEISMEDGMKAYHELLHKVWLYNQRILRAIKSVKGNTFYKHLVEFIKNAEPTEYHEFEIVNSPVGKEQQVSEYGRQIKKEWVVQRAEGDSGDSWSGTICVQIKENKYLKFNFSM